MKVIMTGGGTGGHIYPAIAIADKIKSVYKDAEILFVGTKQGLENDIVPRSGYPIQNISVKGFYRKKIWRNLGTLQKAMKGLAEANKVIKEFNPDVVIGTGGYVCGPVVFAASRKNIKTYIHEQNAFPGVTNKILARFVDKIFISFDASRKYFKNQDKIVFTGNPLRKEFIGYSREKANANLKRSGDGFTIVCFGGSRGAEKINEAMLGVIEILNKIEDIHLFFITGKIHYKDFMEKIEGKGIELGQNIKILDYADNMVDYMYASDLVISRAGAITIAEINAAGKPSILIPSPHVTGNHQYYNAKVVADHGAAYIIEDKDLKEETIINIIFKLINSRDILLEMGKCSERMKSVEAENIILENIKF
ncbi:MAG: undecaprenyldiphospho-muramoylpentapeptide beta-N-acetylglucosaminyltransferase [Peptostreptococcales bacterium]